MKAFVRLNLKEFVVRVLLTATINLSSCRPPPSLSLVRATQSAALIQIVLHCEPPKALEGALGDVVFSVVDKVGQLAGFGLQILGVGGGSREGVLGG